MEGSIYSLIPPVLVIICVLLSKKVILSITLGIVSSALIIHDMNVIQAAQAVLESFLHLFYVDGAWNVSNLYLMAFLLLLGVLTAFIARMGGTSAFAQWASKHVKSGAGAQLLAFILGVIIFIDDYFNALTVGEIARPLTDRYRVSREKLAYIIDSTSAPVCVISPISSWGAYIIGLLGVIYATHEIDTAPFIGFLSIIPYNFYAIFSLLFVLVTIFWNIDPGKMKYREVAEIEEEVQTETGKASDLLVPIGVLIIVTLSMMFLTGWQAARALDFMAILENTDTYLSLLVGAIIAIAFALFRYHRAGHRVYVKPFWEGIRSMTGACLILCFAWALIELISAVGTGTYLSGLFASMDFNSAYLPAVLFVISCFMALATGTSWGTFGVMLPIGAQMAMTLDPQIFTICLGAVLAGSVYGDHCSPISDTTILSSAGAKCHHIDHVMTQLPLACFVAVISCAGYLIAGITESMLLSLILTAVIFFASSFALKVLLAKKG